MSNVAVLNGIVFYTGEDKTIKEDNQIPVVLYGETKKEAISKLKDYANGKPYRINSIESVPIAY